MGGVKENGEISSGYGGRGCCNLVIWDFLLTVAAVGFSVYYGFDKTLHPAWCFVIGLVSAIVLVALMNIRILGKILQILLSAFWALVGTSLIASLFHADTLWQIVIFAVLTILFIGLHLVSAEEIGIGPNSVRRVQPIVFEEPVVSTSSPSQIDTDLAQLTQRYQKLGQQREMVMEKAVQLLQKGDYSALRQAFEENNRIWQEGSAKLTELSGKLEQLHSMPGIYATIGVIREYLDKMEVSNEAVMQQVISCTSPPESGNPPSSGGFDPFAGCDTLEKLEQRYRQLAKSFHPDTGNGDTEGMQYINAEYEKRKREFR